MSRLTNSLSVQRGSLSNNRGSLALDLLFLGLFFLLLLLLLGFSLVFLLDVLLDLVLILLLKQLAEDAGALVAGLGAALVLLGCGIRLVIGCGAGGNISLGCISTLPGSRSKSSTAGNSGERLLVSVASDNTLLGGLGLGDGLLKSYEPGIALCVVSGLESVLAAVELEGELVGVLLLEVGSLGLGVLSVLLV